jgi:hypothetical protein
VRSLVVVAVSSLLAACSGISYNDQNKVEGTYTLRSVNGQPLPLLLDDRTVQFTVTRGELTLAANGEWFEALSGTGAQNGQAVAIDVIETGRWTRRSSHVEMIRFDGALDYSGEYSILSGPKLELQRPVRSTFARYVYTR